MLCVQFLWKPGSVGRFSSFWEYHQQYVHVTGDLSGYAGTHTPGHLWFVLFLFCFSVAGLPLLLLLRSPAGGRWVAGVAASASAPGAVFLPCVPILTIVTLAAVQTDAGVWTKFLGVNLLTIPATFLACKLLVRRTRLARFLFGLKPARGTG